jgi:hypothetical protein
MVYSWFRWDIQLIIFLLNVFDSLEHLPGVVGEVLTFKLQKIFGGQLQVLTFAPRFEKQGG